MLEKSEFVYALKDKNGRYWNEEYQFFTKNLYVAGFYRSKSSALATVRYFKLKFCKIIKVRIEEVEE